MSKFGGESLPVIVCGNKIDKKRVVASLDAAEWVKNRTFAAYYETSAMKDLPESGVPELFTGIVEKFA